MRILFHISSNPIKSDEIFKQLRFNKMKQVTVWTQVFYFKKKINFLKRKNNINKLPSLQYYIEDVNSLK